MKTDILTPKTLFQQDVRYTIPLFQRPYVWTQDEQWGPLWDDVQNVAESYLEELERCGGNTVEAERATAAHFLGAVVVQQVPTPTLDINQREVIDGQQRMTTVQLLLDAIQQVCERLGLQKNAYGLSKLVANDDHLVKEEKPHHVFKLWPTRTDQEAFRHAMDNGLAVNDFEESLIVQAHDFFQLQVEKWLQGHPDTLSERADALEVAVTAMLQLIVIDLDDKDDPNVIFETLNARGTPLEQSDLVKNFVMSQSGETVAGDGGTWGNLDDQWWRTEVRQGRLFRPRLDMLLNYWLATRTGDDVPPRKVFDTFRRCTVDASVVAVMSDVKRDFAEYRRFETAGQRSQGEDLFYYRLNVMQAGVITPVLLLLLSVEHQSRIQAFKALESFLVRRMICRQTTKDYNRLTLELATRLRESGLQKADAIVASFLKGQEASSREWPSDTAITSHLANSPLYRLLTRGRLRLVLEGIESQLRSTKSEQTAVPTNLTIEHLMPVSWKGHWPNPVGPDAQIAEYERNQLVHTIGNLTLLNSKLNSSVSNNPWPEKKAEFLKYAVLNLNGELMNAERWDDEVIRERSKTLAGLVTKCWPGPDAAEWRLE